MKLQRLNIASGTNVTLNAKSGRVNVGLEVLDEPFRSEILTSFYGESGIEITEIAHANLKASDPGNSEKVVFEFDGKASFPSLEDPAEGLASPLFEASTKVLVTFELSGPEEMLGVTLGHKLPPGWRFVKSFPDLPVPFEYGNLRYGFASDDSSQQSELDAIFALTDCYLYLTTHDHSQSLEDGREVSLEAGLNVVGRWNPGGMLGLIAHAADGAGGLLIVSGQIIPSLSPSLPILDDEFPWDTSPRIPGLHLAVELGNGPSLSNTIKLTNLRLQSYSPLSQSWPLENPSYGPEMAYLGDLEISSIRRLTVSAEVSPGRPGALVLACKFVDINVENLLIGASEALVGNQDLISLLPPRLRNALGKLGPQSASMTLVNGGPGIGYEVASTQLTIGMGKGAMPWSPFTGMKIAFESVKMEVARPFEDKRTVSAMFKGKLEFLKTKFDVKVETPRFLISAVQIGSTEIKLEEQFKEWKLDFPGFLPDKVELANISLSAQFGSYYAFAMSLGTSFEFEANGSKHSFPTLHLAVSYNALGAGSWAWQFKASARPGDMGFPVGALIAQAARDTGITVPKLPVAIEGLTVDSVTISHNSERKQFIFECRGVLPLDGETILQCSFTVEKKNPESKFGGEIHLSRPGKLPLSFRLQFREDTNSQRALAFSGRIPSGISLTDIVTEIAGTLGVDCPQSAIPEALNPALTALHGYLNIDTKETVLSAETASGTTIVVAAAGPAHSKKYAFLIDKKMHLGLSSLPLVGDKIAEVSGKIAGVEDVGIENLQAIITYGLRRDKQGHQGQNKTDHGSDVEELNRLIENAAAMFNAGALLRIPEAKQFELQSSKFEIYLSATYFFSDTPQPPLTFPFDGASAKVDRDVAFGSGTGQSLARADSQATWLDVQRNFGPVSVKRLGIACVKGEVRLLLDASLAVSSLTMDLQGLSLAFPIEAITKFNTEQILASLSTKLDGLSLTYESGPVAISGGLLKVDPRPENTRHAYNGELLLKANSWALSAIGSFAQMTNGESSLFAFAVLNAALGGPAFFFVTGIAAGFGYNRSLRLPTLNDLPDFPLIAASETGNRDKLTKEIDNFVYAAAGQNWLAAGVRFTSFKVIDSFALLTVFFGKRFEVGLLGLATISMPARPKKGSSKQTTEAAVAPIAYAQLALVATYAPDDGVLKIAAQLMPGAYILSEKCRLTGGFALYTWFQDEFERDTYGKLVYDGNTNQKKLVKSGFRAGDFVLSIGGYHPDFKPPAHYPSVPRVGANWRVSDKLTIKGGLYFALTPLAIMAGGSLEANYEDGNLKAWFNSRVDFLLYWEPLSYHANLKVMMGASYTMSWFFTTKTISTQVAVDVELYGPPFGGKAAVDLYVCSFTIDFGAKPALPEKLNWSQFEDRFLPAASDLCLSRAGGGLVREIFTTKSDGSIDGGSSTWVVSSEKFVIVTSSAIPCSVLPLVNGKTATVENPKAFPPFGVKPCEIPNSRLKSEQRIEWTLEDGAPAQDMWEIEPVTQRLPRAAWDAPELRSETLSQSIRDPEKLTKMVLNDLGKDQVTDELITGFRLTPKPKTAGSANLPAPVMRSELLMNAREIAIPANSWENPDIPRTAPYDNGTALSRYGYLGYLADRNMQRLDISAALKRQEIEVNPNPTTRYLAPVATKQEFLVAPFISKLGGMQP